MDAKEIIKKYQKLNEAEIFVTPELVAEIYDQANIDYEIYEDEKIVEYKCVTDFDTYSYYTPTYGSKSIMTLDDYFAMLSDICTMFTLALPDGFEDFIDTEALYERMKDNTAYIISAVNFINERKDKDLPILLGEDTANVNGIVYMLIEEK